MKAAIFIFTATALLATPALADPGHFTASHGHSHWLAAGALGLAAVTGAVALWKSRKPKKAAACIAERKA